MPRGKKSTLVELTDVQLGCRDLQHAWDLDSAVWARGARTGTYERLLTCMRCKSTRMDRIQRDGSKYSRYTHSEGYLLDHPLGRGYNRQVRLEILRRVGTIWASLDLAGEES